MLTLAMALAPASSGCAVEEADLELGSESVAIVGGISTNDYAAVPLLYVEFASGAAAVCSGTLISPQVVLTAAHCLEFDEEPTSFLAYFGTDATIENDPMHLDSVNVSRYHYDPEWDINDLEGGHDIGLVLLERQGPVEPIGYNRNPLTGREGDNVRLVGWGRTDGDGTDYGRKREVMSSLQAHNNLLMQYGSATANTCQGDSGGPNFMTQDGREVVAGITSYGNVGCDQYGVGTNVSAYASTFIDPWIGQNDPSGGCLADSQCVQACGQVDPDCAGGDGGDSGGDGSGDGGGDGSGDGTGPGGQTPAPSAVTGGCSSGTSQGPAGLMMLVIAGLWATRRRIRCH